MSSAWNCWHITIAFVYTAIGIAQIVAGLIFLFSFRLIDLSGFLWIGSLDTVIGIGGGIVACHSEISTARQKVLLFMSVAVLLINTVNTIVSEYYFVINSLYVRNNRLEHLNPRTYQYAKLSGLVLVLVAFFDALATFASYSNLKLKKYRRFLETSRAENKVPVVASGAEAALTPAKNPVASSPSFDPDLAFVIDSPHLKAKKAARADVLPHETQTDWVFGTRSVSTQDIGTSTNSPVTPRKLIVPTTAAANDYFVNTLQTFSRSPSPAASMHNLSKTESDYSADERVRALPPELQQQQQQHETVSIVTQVPLAKKIRKNNPYSNLMAELEKAFETKKKVDADEGRAESVESLEASSVSTTSSSKQFGRELEAVLQSIEHLDSPENEEENDDAEDDGYQYGSKTSIVTSGYSSPTSGPRPAPNLNYSISTNPENNATIISLMTPTTPTTPAAIVTTTTTTTKPEEDQSKLFKSVTEIKTESAKEENELKVPKADCNGGDGSGGSGGSSGSRKSRFLSFLGQKRRPDKLSKKTFLLPEVENAILKSETLAFLTRDQLLDKVEQNVALRRKIERKVQQQKQQLGHTVSESQC